jgi:hypothetical protein
MVTKYLSKSNMPIRNIITCMLIIFVLVFLFLPNFAFASTPSLIETINKEGVTKAWTSVLSLVNYFIIFVLIAIGLANILRINIETYAIKKILPSLIIAVVLANFSRLFCLAILEVVQVLTVWAQNFGADAGSWGSTGVGGLLKAFFSQVFNWGDKISQIKIAVSPSSSGLAAFWTGFTTIPSMIGGFILGFILIIIALIIFLILFFLLLIREVVVVVLVAVSPLAFISLALPMTNQYFKMWWENFSKWTFMPVIAYFVMALGLRVSPVFGASSFIKFFFLLGVLITAIIVPFKLGGSIMGAWGSLGNFLLKAPRLAGGVTENMGKKRGSAGMENFGAKLKKYGSYTDVGTYVNASKKILGTLEEDRQNQAIREVGGSPLMRKYVAPDFFKKLVYERSGAVQSQRSPGDIMKNIEEDMADKSKGLFGKTLSNKDLSSLKNGEDAVNYQSMVHQLIQKYNTLSRSPSVIARAEAANIQQFLDSNKVPWDNTPQGVAPGSPAKGFSGWQPQAISDAAVSSPTQGQGGTGETGGGISVSGRGLSIGGKAGSSAVTILNTKELAEDEARAGMRIGKAFGGTSGSTSFTQPSPEEQSDLYRAQGLAKAHFAKTPFLSFSDDIAQESYMGSAPGVLATKYAPRPGGAIDLGQASELTRQIESYQNKLKSDMPKLAEIEQDVSFSANIRPENAAEIKEQAYEQLKHLNSITDSGMTPSDTDIELSTNILAKVNPKYQFKLGAVNTTDVKRDLKRAFKAARVADKLKNVSKNMTPAEIDTKRKVIAKEEVEIDRIENSISGLTQKLEKSIDSPDSIDIQRNIEVNVHDLYNIAKGSSKNKLKGDKASELSKNIVKSIQNELKQGLKISDIFNKEDFRNSIVKQVESAVANVQSTVQNTVANQANNATQNTPTPPTA